MAYESDIKQINSKIDGLHSLVTTLIDKGDQIKKMADDLGVHVIVNETSSKVVLEIVEINKLTAARRILREINGSWKDKQKQVWSSGRNVLVSWENKDNPLFEIWLCTVPEEFPEELKGKNCNFEERIERTQVLVCKR